MQSKSKYSGETKKIEVDVEEKRFLINVVNMAKDLDQGPAMITTVRTSFIAPDTGKRYPVKVMIAAKPEIRMIADESDLGLDDITTLAIDGLIVIPVKERD